MKIIRYAVLTGLLALLGGWAVAQQQGQEPQQEGQQEGQPAQEEAAEVPLPPRKVGEVRTQAEMDAWNAVANAAKPEQADMARSFLEQFPDSGMTPHAHYVIAMSAFAQNDFPTFMMHGEQALEELPQAVDLASQLAFYYAETKEFDKAQMLAGKVTATLDDEQAGANFQPQQRDQLLGAAHFAIGRSQLGEYMASRENPEKLDEAIEHLEMAAQLNPTDDYAYYRLGSAYRQKNEANQCIKYFALAAATGTAVGNAAMQSLEEIYGLLNKDVSQIEARVQEAQQTLRENVAAKQKQWAEEAAARAAAQTPPPSEGAASPPPGSASEPPPSR
ncbi:MAG TPA: tetratricopeptide repeat protein [Acidobacteriota bacterium]|nr:tetratricopeptide repeat protein [Acidobacteriota bacterium]